MHGNMNVKVNPTHFHNNIKNDCLSPTRSINIAASKVGAKFKDKTRQVLKRYPD